MLTIVYPRFCAQLIHDLAAMPRKEEGMRATIDFENTGDDSRRMSVEVMGDDSVWFTVCVYGETPCNMRLEPDQVQQLIKFLGGLISHCEKSNSHQERRDWYREQMRKGF